MVSEIEKGGGEASSVSRLNNSSLFQRAAISLEKR